MYGGCRSFARITAALKSQFPMPTPPVTQFLARLVEATKDAFNQGDLTPLVLFHLNEQLPNVVPASVPGGQIVFELVGWAVRTGVLFDLA